jgi:hypothetical protein
VWIYNVSGHQRFPSYIIMPPIKPIIGGFVQQVVGAVAVVRAWQYWVSQYPIAPKWTADAQLKVSAAFPGIDTVNSVAL